MAKRCGIGHTADFNSPAASQPVGRSCAVARCSELWQEGVNDDDDRNTEGDARR
jgi:hypothetical protein